MSSHEVVAPHLPLRMKPDFTALRASPVTTEEHQNPHAHAAHPRTALSAGLQWHRSGWDRLDGAPIKLPRAFVGHSLASPALRGPRPREGPPVGAGPRVSPDRAAREQPRSPPPRERSRSPRFLPPGVNPADTRSVSQEGRAAIALLMCLDNTCTRALEEAIDYLEPRQHLSDDASRLLEYAESIRQVRDMQ